jgi:hypothetical protein
MDQSESRYEDNHDEPAEEEGQNLEQSDEEAFNSAVADYAAEERAKTEQEVPELCAVPEGMDPTLDPALVPHRPGHERIPPVDKKALGITEGRIVHYQVEALNGNGSGMVECRAAIIVQSWPNSSYLRGEVNLSVFTDHRNDQGLFGGHDPIVWQTSVPHYKPHQRGSNIGDRIPKTWHFPQDCQAGAEKVRR